MEKSPAFQFYPKDFLVDTALLTNEQCGIYIKLMGFSWIGIPGCKQTELPNDPATLARIAAVVGEDFLTKIEPVIALFLPGEDGKIYHKRLRKELKKQAKHRKQRVKAGKASAEARQRALNERSDSVERESNSSSSSSSATPVSQEEGGGTPPPSGDSTTETLLMHRAEAAKIPNKRDTVRRYLAAWCERAGAAKVEEVLMRKEARGLTVIEIQDRFFADGVKKSDPTVQPGMMRKGAKCEAPGCCGGMIFVEGGGAAPCPACKGAGVKP